MPRKCNSLSAPVRHGNPRAARSRVWTRSDWALLVTIGCMYANSSLHMSLTTTNNTFMTSNRDQAISRRRYPPQLPGRSGPAGRCETGVRLWALHRRTPDRHGRTAIFACSGGNNMHRELRRQPHPGCGRGRAGPLRLPAGRRHPAASQAAQTPARAVQGLGGDLLCQGD